MPKRHKQRSVMQHRFSEVPKAEIPRSTFDRSFGHKTTINAGWLYPIYLDEALPGDTFKVRATIFARMATPIFPIMDNLYLDTQFFAVPMRLLWQNWARFNGEQPNPGDSTDFLIPQVTAPAGGWLEGTLADYFGLPLKQINVSALPFRAYNMIWRDWYRDQNLQSAPTVSVGDGPDAATAYTLLRRGKRHDYFTSCLPWPQKGPGVMIPLGTSAPVFLPSTTVGVGVGIQDGATPRVTRDMNASAATVTLGAPNAGALHMYADLSNATAATINSLRQAFQLQKIYERDARGGTRLIELIKAHFGVTSPDHRMQRPEFLGGGSTPVNIAPVAQTQSTTPESPQGNLAAFGTALAHGHGFTMSFTEHCLILGLASVRADLTYQQGLNRMWSRKTRFDFYWPALAHIGEQSVLLKELYAQNTGDDDTVFGYQERHAEYRYKPSMITGAFRSSHTASLDAWHLSQEFATKPVLDATFIEENPPVDRVVAVTTEPHFIMDCFFQNHTARPMPVYGVPGLIDHF